MLLQETVQEVRATEGLRGTARHHANRILTKTGSVQTQDRIQRSNIRCLVFGSKALKWGREGSLENLSCFQNVIHVILEANSLRKTGNIRDSNSGITEVTSSRMLRPVDW